jgi:hypothetical protein
MLSDKTLAYAEQFTTALLGIDALYRRESGDEEGLVVVNMSAGRHQPEPFPDYAAAQARFGELKALASGLPESDRRLYYTQACDSTLAFIRWRLGNLPFTGQLRGFLHVPPEPVSETQLDNLRAQMRSLLNRLGYSGDLAQQFAAWEAKNRVPPDEVPGVLAEMLDIAWDRTEQRLHIPAEKSDGMQVVPVHGAAFNARCNYLERKIELNVDPVLTRQSLKHLTTHEAYPGHYVQFKLRETWYHQGKAPADGLLSVVNTASSSSFEGIADNGLTLIEWIEDDDDRLQGLLSRYRSAIGTGAAWRLHARPSPRAGMAGWTEDQVADWLRRQTLAGGEGWVTGRMRFISAPARAVLIWSYWWGEATVTPVYLQTPADRRSEFLEYLYGRMHSNQTVGMFQ